MGVKADYRPDIDGLRAVAVIAILLFHLNKHWLPGGFVGVDVFFVISGYLITRNISKEIAADSFSFSSFYYRRARRLLPALLAVIAGTFVVSAFTVLPTEMKSLAAATIYSLFSASNFYFWLHSGYFDLAAASQPLLHTWSLSVEEQFYFLWPALLLALSFRHRYRLAICFVIIAVGTLAATGISQIAPSAGFYLLPFRIQEFAVGAVVALGSYRLTGRARNLGALVGAGLIAASVTLFNEGMSFPSYWALLPCIGTGLVIKCAEGTLISSALSVRPVTYIGRVSYSLYLCHWPAIVLYDMSANPLTGAHRTVVLLLLIGLLTVVLHYFVERRFRYARATSDRRTRFVLAYSLAAGIVVAPAASAALGDGWVWLVPAELRKQMKPADTAEIYRTNNTEGRKPFSTSRIRVLVIGDSHQADFFNALDLNREALPDIEVRSMRLDDACFYMFAKEPIPTPDGLAVQLVNQCKQEVSDFQTSDRSRSSDVIVISSRWDDIGIDHFHDFAQWVQSNFPARLIALGRTMEFKPVPKLLSEYYELGDRPSLRAFAAANRNTALDQVNDKLERISHALDVPFFRKDGWICDIERAGCDILDANGNPAIYDYGHWTLEGARFYGQRIVEGPVIAAIRNLSQ